MDRGQVTVEYIIITGIVAVVFLVTVNFIMAERKAASQSLWSLDGQDTAESIAQAINSVYLAGYGAVENVTTAKRLVGGIDYEIIVYRRLVSIQVASHKREFEWKFQTADVNGSDNGLTLKPGILVLENVNGTVYIISK